MRDKGPILIPLDGSPLAEGALAYGVAFAKALGERVVLVTAWEGTETEVASDFPTMALEIEQKANDYYSAYLDGIRTRLGPSVQVETRVVAGDAAEQILKAAEDTKARLLVIATHGRSGIGRWMYGSTASRLLRESQVPLVAVGPHALQRSTADVSLQHVMVPLDGSPLSEAALPVAKTLAAALKARLTLVRVVRWAVQTYPYSLPDAYIPQVDQELEAGAKAYLQRQEADVKGLPVDAFVVRGAVADGLMDVTEKQSVDLVVMTTHARRGLARAALGSTADRMLQGKAPVLLVPPEAAEHKA
jgi:nucleotide-binding universal stress UspA family protein